jgi:hypothetical protein
VLIRMHAASLNFRDQLLLTGRYPIGGTSRWCRCRTAPVRSSILDEGSRA